MVKIAISELLSSKTCSFMGDGWARVHHPAIGHEVLMAEHRGTTAHIVSSAGISGVWLLRHGWSGAALISYSGKSVRVELSSAVEDLAYFVKIDAQGGLPTEVEVKVDCDEGTPASHAQVWIIGLCYDELPMPKSKSQTLSMSTRLIEGDWGHFLALSNDQVIPAGILSEGSWGPKDIEIFKKHVQPGTCVLDIGTHIGHHTIVFSKLVGKDGLVISVEAQRVMFQLLNANCVINGAHNVRPVHSAASDHRHFLHMYPISYTGDNNYGALGVNLEVENFPEGSRGELVQAVCVDDLVEQYSEGRTVSFIKLDVQAYEKYAISGLLRTIARDRPKIFFEASAYWMKRAGYDYREIYALLRALGYRFEHFRKLPLDANGVPDLPFDDQSEWDALAYPG